ncbi:MAG: hypothetical protein ACXABO_21390 [Promethearchaeota archaeon]
MMEREKKKDFYLFFICLIILILGIIWGITYLLGVTFFCVVSCELTILFLGPVVLMIFLGICFLINNHRMKGLLLVITGSPLTGAGLYFTIFLLSNEKILRSKSGAINLTIIPIIIGIVMIVYGIRLMMMRVKHNLV